MLQEYLAAAIGVSVGSYWQISNNYHAYVEMFEKYADVSLEDQRYPMSGTTPLVNDPTTFIEEVEAIVYGRLPVFKNRFLSDTAWPMLHNYKARKNIHPVAAMDWRMASQEWLEKK